jgi:hypothetical protein
MKISLFIDESGFQQDEERPAGTTTPDVLGGLLWLDDEGQVASSLKRWVPNLLQNCPLPDGQQLGIKDLHLTELRRSVSQDWLQNFVPDLLNTACPKGKATYVAVTRRGGGKGDREQRERDYRVMFAELIALIGVLPNVGEVEHFSITYASRATDDEPLTFVPQMLEAFDRSLDWDLLTRSFARLSSNQVQFTRTQANGHYGLIAADFLCNTVFNALRGFPDSATLVDKLISDGIFHVFEAFGDRQQRRARLAERDERWAEALQRWLIWKPGPSAAVERKEAIQRCIHRVLDLAGSTATSHALEGVREYIHRNEATKNDPSSRFRILSELENALENTGLQRKCPTHLLFRLRNYLLQTANHMMDVDAAQLLINRQMDDLPALLKDPQYLNDVLSVLLYKSETQVNALELVGSQETALQYSQAVHAYSHLVGCLTDALPSGAQATITVKTELKASFTNLRCRLLTVSSPDDPNLAVIWNELELLRGNCLPGTDDWNRISTYSIWTKLKQMKTLEAVEEGRSLITGNPNYIWGWFWAARATIDHALSLSSPKNMIGVDQFAGSLKSIITHNVVISGFEFALLQRETAILYGVVLGKRGHVSPLDKDAIKNMQDAGNKSPLGMWLSAMAHMAEPYRWNNEADWQNLFSCENSVANARSLDLAHNTIEDANGITPFRALRYMSPY